MYRTRYCGLRYLIAVLFGGLFLLYGAESYAAVRAAGQTQKLGNIRFAKNIVGYVDPVLKFRVESPKGWYGAVQAFDKKGEPRYSIFPKGAVALYLKYYGRRQKQPTPFNPFIAIKVHREEAPRKLRETLEGYLAAVYHTKISGLDQEPIESTSNGVDWIQGKLTFRADVKGESLPCVGKIYVCTRENGVLMVDMITTRQESTQDLPTLDEFIAQIRWADDIEDLLGEKGSYMDLRDLES